MIVMLSYLDRLLLNNTFSGLALEAVMTDPIPNIINTTKLSLVETTRQLILMVCEKCCKKMCLYIR